MIYFAHPFEERRSEYKEKIIKKLRECHDPFKAEKWLEIKHGGDFYTNPSPEFAREIVKADLKAIEQSSSIIAWIPRPSVGTVVELFYAYLLGKSPRIVMTPIVHPFIIELSTEWYLSVEAGRCFHE